MVSKTEPFKKPAKDKFTPKVVIGVMIFNEKYGKTSYGNLENVIGDEKRVRDIFKFLGISDKNIFYLKDGTFDKLDMLFTDIKRKY